MRVCEIHKAVEQELGRPVVYSTVKDCLREKRRKIPLFERVAHGQYRLRIDVDPPDSRRGIQSTPSCHRPQPTNNPAHTGYASFVET